MREAGGAARSERMSSAAVATKPFNSSRT